MPAWKRISRLLLLCGSILFVTFLFPSNQTIIAERSHAQNACVRVFEQFEHYTVNVFQFDTNTQAFSKLSAPVLSPVAQVSPDGKHAAFLRTLDNPEQWQNRQIGLYIAQTDGSQPPVLLTI